MYICNIDICIKHLQSLEGHSMIEKTNNFLLKPTSKHWRLVVNVIPTFWFYIAAVDYGLIMDKYYIKLSTMSSITNKKDISSLRDVVCTRPILEKQYSSLIIYCSYSHDDS